MVADAETARSDFTLEATPHFPLIAVKRAALKARPLNDTTAMPLAGGTQVRLLRTPRAKAGPVSGGLDDRGQVPIDRGR